MLSWIEVNLPSPAESGEEYDWKDYYDVDDLFQPGNLIDCESYDYGRKTLLVGHINTATGKCGCCDIGITFVYRYAKMEIPCE